jgi:preprotein translocase subunit SecG
MFVNALVMTLLFLTSLFLILLVLIQRGRGGGLAGAFGGLGGQSAFGTKAGDLFTRITIFVAAFWIILCAASVKLLNDTSQSVLAPNLGGNRPAASEPAGGSSKATGGKAGAAGGGKAAAPESKPAAEPAAESKAASGQSPAGEPASDKAK